MSAALFIACMVQVADYFNRLEWLNIETLRMARAVLPFDDSIRSLSNGEIENRPIKVLVITNEMYERDFDQASPLDRSKLAQLFRTLLSPQNSPAVLAVDLDLSPSPSYPEVEKEFYTELKALVKNSTTQLVLITPMRTMLPDSIRNKLAWMRDMCAGGIHFALPDIVGVQNTIINLPVGVPILGYETYRIAGGLRGGYIQGQFDPTDITESSSPRQICNYSDQELKGMLQLLGLRVPVTQTKGYMRINFSFPEAIDLIRLSSLKSLNDGQEDLSRLKKRVVFLGGDYGDNDKYQTPVGPLSGMYLHVAAYYSNIFKVSALTKPVALVTDLITSILFALLFLCVLDKICSTRSMTFRLLEVFLPPALSFLAILSAAFALGWWNVWLHPATIITGMGTYIAIVHPTGFTGTEIKSRALLPDRLVKYVIYYPMVLGGLIIVFL